MKKYMYIAMCWMVALFAGADLIVSSSTSSLTTNLFISQLNTDGAALQSRYTSVSDWKGIGQSFKWDTDMGYLDGFGLKIDQTQAAYPSNIQHYVFVQQLDGFRGVPTSTVYQAEFTMQSSYVQAGNWVHFDIDPLVMQKDQYYGITVVAKDMISGHRIYWATTADYNNAITGGDANQIDIPTKGIPPGNNIAFSGASRDLAMYVQAIPEASTVSLFLISMCTAFGLRRLTIK